MEDRMWLDFSRDMPFGTELLFWIRNNPPKIRMWKVNVTWTMGGPSVTLALGKWFIQLHWYRLREE